MRTGALRSTLRKRGVPMPEAMGKVHYRRTAALVGMIVTAAMVVGCSSASAGPSASSGTTGDPVSCGSGAKPTVYMIGSVTNSTTWQAIENGWLAGGRDFCLHAVYSAPNQSTDPAEIALISSALAAHPAGIAINYVDHTIYQSTLDAVNGHLAVVLFNNNRFEPVNGVASTATTDPRITSLAFVGQNEDKSGAILATAFLPYIPAGKAVLWFPVSPGVEVITLRGNGVYSVLDAHGIKHEFLEAPGAPGQEGLDESQDEAVVCAYLKAHPEIGAVVATSATAPATALCEQKEGLHLPIAEFDIDLQSAQFVQKGIITVVLDQQPWLQGYLSAENLALEIRYHLSPVNVSTGTLLVTKANVANVIAAIKDGKD
jgi:ABC-type sugar transport system substrate-binding protein